MALVSTNLTAVTTPALTAYDVITADTGDVTAPTITSDAATSVAGNATLSFTLTADEDVTWTITGGADQAQFQISTDELQWIADGSQDYSSPADANADNVYVVIVRATDASDNYSEQTISVTVTEPVSLEGVPMGLLLAITYPA